jgi:hypothetical protein
MVHEPVEQGNKTVLIALSRTGIKSMNSTSTSQSPSFTNDYLWDPVVFRPGFNNTQDSLTANQAWSLFFTAGQGDKILGSNPEAGRFLRNLLIALGVTGALWAGVFTHVV